MAIALSIAYTATPLAAGTKLLVEATPQSSPGKNFFRRSDFRVLQVSAAAAASPLNVLAAYNTMYGALVAGKKIAFRLTPISAGGFRGEPQEVQVVVT